MNSLSPHRQRIVVVALRPDCVIASGSWQRLTSCLILAMLLLFSTKTSSLAQEKSASEQKPIDFATEIRPILTEKCLNCHGGEKPEGGLRLSDQEGIFGKGESGAVAVVPGKPDRSELHRRITSDDPAVCMPPEDEKPLTQIEIEKLTRWISEGARWSSHWAFLPLAEAVPPMPVRKDWARNEIDQFILEKLVQSGIAPSAEADRYTLIKRLHYDLIGLPPSIEEVDAFVADQSPLAYESLVNRLLESRHFGERWGRHWLDLAHFADSDGYEKDRARPDAYIYRDWVIDAFNRDLPYDQFTIEQLAGDLLPDSTPSQQIATGFLRQTLTNEEGGVDQEEYRVAACFDRTETVGTVWMGLTIGCVRCHDHKYDPLLQTEYYQLFAFFNNAEEVTSSLPVEADDLAELERELRPLKKQLASRYAELSPGELEWETIEHQRILKQPEAKLEEIPLEITSVSAQTLPESALKVTSNQVVVQFDAANEESRPSIPETESYSITLNSFADGLTGFKVYAIPDKRFPAGGSGLGTEGAFVLTGFEVQVLNADGSTATIPLHRINADFVARGYRAESVIEKQEGATATGWSVAGKVSEKHWIQFRTLEPLRLPPDAQLRLVLHQQAGQQNLLGSFQIAGLRGDERGLHIPDDKIASSLEMYPEKRVAGVRQQLFDYYVTRVVQDQQALKIRQQINDVQRRHQAKLLDVRTISQPRLSRTTYVFHRGEFLSHGDVVSAGVPGILPEFSSRGEQGDRLDFARWLVSDQNDLMPRVAVNQVWQHLFGQGLVTTPSDFGTRGEFPSHPELLDWLAGRFRSDMKWSRKELIRTIVNSATYRQASVRRPEIDSLDPTNRLLSRQNRFRVESELVRDLTLSVSGLLTPTVGGPSVFPPMPEDLAKLSYANSFAWKDSTGKDRYRRGMYTFFKRTIPHPNLMTFDSPDANVACCERTVSNTPLQALILLNNEVHTEGSQALAARLLVEFPSADASEQMDRQRLTKALRLCVARPPEELELQALLNVLHASRSYYDKHPEQAAQLINLHAPPDVSPAEAASWVATVRVILNLDEFLTRE